LPGFSGVPLYDVFIFLYSELKKDDLPTRANSVAFSFFLSIFPFVIFLLPLLSWGSMAEEYIQQLETSMEDVFPETAKTYFFDIISSIRQEGSFGLQGFGFLLSIIFASSGMMTLMHGFDKSYSISFKSRGYFKKRFVALFLTLLLAFILFMSLGLIISSHHLLHIVVEHFKGSSVESLIFIVVKWLIIVLLFYSVITSIYRYGPSIYRPLRLINPGATLATIFSLIASVLFSYFINNFGRYNEIYGSIGALIVILLWLQINAFIILAGFELNASIIVNRDKRLILEEAE
jgi:membrane protein